MKKHAVAAVKLEKELALDALLFAFAVLLVAFLYRNTILLTAIIVAAWLFATKVWHSKTDTILFVVAAVAGSSAEIVAILFGAWRYADPSFLGIPMWLPFLWGSAVVFIKRVSDTISKLVNIKG